MLSFIICVGTITLSCPDPFDPEFSLCFLRMVEGTLLEATVPNPGIIFLPIENSLRLTVNHVSPTQHFEPQTVFTSFQAVENFGYPVIGAKRERSQSLEQSTMQPNVTSFGDSRLPSPPMPPFDLDKAEDDEVKPLLLKQITHTPAGLKLSRGEKSTLKVNAQSAFLATEIAKLPEYADFKKARHSAQSNAAVVQSWQFAAKVDQDYAGSLVGVSTILMSSLLVSQPSAHFRDLIWGLSRRQQFKLPLASNLRGCLVRRKVQNLFANTGQVGRMRMLTSLLS